MAHDREFENLKMEICMKLMVWKEMQDLDYIEIYLQKKILNTFPSFLVDMI